MIKYAINIRYDSKTKVDYAYEICISNKLQETRSRRVLDRFIGQRVGIIRTGKGKAQLIGEVNITGVTEYLTEKQFTKALPIHLVKKGSDYWWKKKKYGYLLSYPELYEKPIDVGWHPENGDNRTYRIIAWNIN